MIFVFPITIPKSTSATAPIMQTLQLTAGTLTHVEIQYPSGVVALAHCQMRYGLHQLFPSNPEASFATSNETIDWLEDLEVDQPPYQLTFVGWNTDSSFDHTLTVRCVMNPPASVTNLASEVARLLATSGGA